MNRFNAIMLFILSWEGGEAHLKGENFETKYGITSRSHPEVNMKTLTKAQAIDIYKNDYYLKYKIDKLPQPLDAIFMDFRVNGGFDVNLAKLETEALSLVYEKKYNTYYVGEIVQHRRFCALTRRAVEGHKLDMYENGLSKRFANLSNTFLRVPVINANIKDKSVLFKSSFYDAYVSCSQEEPINSIIHGIKEVGGLGIDLKSLHGEISAMKKTMSSSYIGEVIQHRRFCALANIAGKQNDILSEEKRDYIGNVIFRNSKHEAKSGSKKKIK